MKRFHISRWKYWWGYLAILILALLSIWFNDRAADTASWTAGISAGVLLLVFEFMIRRDMVTFKGDRLVHRSGGKATPIAYRSITDVYMHQSAFQKAVGYGDVLIDVPGHDPNREVEFMLKDFARPRKIEKELNKQIHSAHSKHPHHKGKPHVGP